ncbi:hypothetical protein KY092_08220 [Natronomonas gomsonensis]|nr:hypothetical protein [Natronomonas gomsonensis]MCY4730543.1 hypothetical protein [Natronomonas gomsonensis]
MIESAGSRFAGIGTLLFLGAPIAAYLSGDARIMFYVHVALGAFWFGLDFFFKFVLGPSLDEVADEVSGTVNQYLVPKMALVAEPLSVGVVGSGIGLAEMMGYFNSPSIWIHGALGVSALMLLIGFGPIHFTTAKMSVELSMPEPDGERIEDLFGTTMKWGLVQTVLMLLIIAMMTGIRWQI